ncbi:MAG: hypothetical protein K6C94_07245 [Candidatus Gastranaerophilales bacterium]|nr:hypothetical protein [Candidatus Gastranaerophilales bacterium]
METSILGVILSFLVDFFASPVPLLLLIILKVFFGEKVKNKPFWIIFAVLFIAMTALGLSSVVVMSNFTKIRPLTVFQKFNLYTAPFVINFCSYFVKCFLYLLPLILFASLVYFLKTKDKNILKKIFVTLLILAPFALVSYPFFVLEVQNAEVFSEQEARYMADNKIPPVRAFYTAMVADVLEMNFLKECFNHGKNPDVSSEKAKQLIDEYIKYRSDESALSGYDWNYLYMLRIMERLDELQKVVEKIEAKKGIKISAELDLLIARKNYEKALETIEQIDFQGENMKDMYYAKIYAGLKNYDKAYEYLEKYKNEVSHQTNLKVYNITKLYLDYKTGKKKLAQEEFAGMSHFVKEYYTLDEYVKSLERVDY